METFITASATWGGDRFWMCQCGGAAWHQHGSVAETPVIVSLNPYIDPAGLTCLNAKRPANLEYVLRPRFLDGLNGNRTPLQSDADAQLILKIPFSGVMKVESISIQGFHDESCPKEMRAFINQRDLDFSSIDRQQPTQTWTMVPPTLHRNEPIEYATRVCKFSQVSHLTLYFPRNHGAASTRIGYVGVFGESLLRKTNPIITNYELLPNPSDHKKAEMTVASKQTF